MKFSKKPVVIEAYRVIDLIKSARQDWKGLPKCIVDAYDHGELVFQNSIINICTLEGVMTADRDDWVIRGVKGELYPCKPDIFAETYDELGEVEPQTKGMNFGSALGLLKSGKCVARSGWNGKGMFVYMVPENAYEPTTEAEKIHYGGSKVPYNAYLAIKNVNETVSTWVPSINDVLADDWAIYYV